MAVLSTLPGGEVGHAHQRLDARARLLVQPFQAAPHQRAVLAQQRHHVGDRAQRHQVEQALFDLGNGVDGEAAAMPPSLAAARSTACARR